ncbi:hypothetical protein DAI22_01g110400 [Oryza sativa Japonica Group]|nr:hypothetical protein DAI22_01g110400 [Oryza sativa Japonica Group]
MGRKAPSVVCCCFPFTVAELVVLAVVCVPAALCHLAVRGGHRRRVCSAKQKEMGELLTLDVTSPRSLAAAAAKARKVEVEFPATPMAEHLGEAEVARWKSGLQAALHWVARLLSSAGEDARPAADLRVLLPVLACPLSPVPILPRLPRHVRGNCFQLQRWQIFNCKHLYISFYLLFQLFSIYS